MVSGDQLSQVYDKNCERTVLITGATGGIGHELAKLFAKDNYNLVLVAKEEDELAFIKKALQISNPDIDIVTFEKDLSAHDAAMSVYGFTREHGITINVLINCAGFGTYGPVNDIAPNKEVEMLQLNVLTLYQMTRLYLKEMVDRDEGHIINISSITAFQPNPYFATYGASKSFVLNFSRALNYELKEQGLGVKVMAVCPSAVKDTSFKIIAGMEHTRTFSSWMAVTAKVVADDTYDAMKCGKDIIIPGKGLGIMQSIACRLPSKLLMRFSRSQLKEN